MTSSIRRRFDSNRYFWLGIIGAVLIVILLIASSGIKKLGVGQQDIYAEFVQAAGVRTGDKVDVAGVPVGQVAGTRLEGDHVLVTLQMKSDVKFGPDARAAIKMATLLGTRYVSVDPGDGSGLKGHRIPKNNTSVPYNLTQNGTPKLEELDTGKLTQSLKVLGDQIDGSPQLTAQALDSVGALAKTINDRRDQVSQLLKDLDRVTKILGDNRNSVLLVITQGEAIANRVMERQALLRQLLDNVAQLTRQLQQIGDQNNNQLGPTIEQLNTIAGGLQKNKDNLDRLLSIMPVSLRQFNNVFGDGPYGEVGLPWLFPDNWLCFARVIEGCQG
ncbi:MCE family protein [Nocardia terpenica]|uniref:Mammalian cell entry protein n=1 Tax=Nocardia terpenica TaxID=455432 RepID=A0A164IAL5_9NOCA|nr:MCE family protein [Nocardia terpenica]KZM69252.1 mammalian cell entry protein [Nocardia terpenica]NQE89118.1 MCE family protein [Nocardia terpenica]